MKKSEIEDIIEDGGVRITAILQLIGKPKEHVEKTLPEFIDSLRKIPQSGFTILGDDVKPTEKQEDSEELYASFAELDIICDSTMGLMNFCMEAMPSSIEIQDPDNMVLRSPDLTSIMNDFVSRIHQVDMVAKQAQQQFKVMALSLGVMAQNAILILLNLGPRSKEGIAEVTGIHLDQIDRFLEKLTEDGKIKESKGKYGLVAPPNLK